MDRRVTCCLLGKKRPEMTVHLGSGNPHAGGGFGDIQQPAALMQQVFEQRAEAVQVAEFKQPLDVAGEEGVHPLAVARHGLAGDQERLGRPPCNGLCCRFTPPKADSSLHSTGGGCTTHLRPVTVDVARLFSPQAQGEGGFARAPNAGEPGDGDCAPSFLQPVEPNRSCEHASRRDHAVEPGPHRR